MEQEVTLSDEMNLEDPDFVDETELVIKPVKTASGRRISKPSNQKYYLRYLFLPLIFMTVTLFGGMRFAAGDNAFIFLRPELICLIFAAILLVLFFRAGFIDIKGWFSESFSGVKNIANGSVLFSLFAASVQLFNSLLPERGIPFWIAAFCLFWMLWTYLFVEFEAKKLVRSLAAAFGLLFVVKYLALANLAAPANENWLQGILANPSKEAFTWLLDLPRFASGTGYLQFFTIILYLAGLYLLPQQMVENTAVKAKQS
jgi:hypothetical protein